MTWSGVALVFAPSAVIEPWPRPQRNDLPGRALPRVSSPARLAWTSGAAALGPRLTAPSCRCGLLAPPYAGHRVGMLTIWGTPTRSPGFQIAPPLVPDPVRLRPRAGASPNASSGFPIDRERVWHPNELAGVWMHPATTDRADSLGTCRWTAWFWFVNWSGPRAPRCSHRRGSSEPGCLPERDRPLPANLRD
jgi:hypothetical protein